MTDPFSRANSIKTIRVFTCRTNATPIDENVRIGYPGLFDYADKINISVAFTWDLKYAEKLANEWKQIAPVEIGGPATGQRGENFEPGLYVKRGYVITSRGCPNRCWFCSVWKREGDIRELPITEGWNVLDDNLLACSYEHINKVFDMLSKQKNPIEFTGGMEAAILKSWHAKRLYELKPKQIFFAYDTENDREPLYEAGKLLHFVGFSDKTHILRTYVLIGYPEDREHNRKADTFENAEARLIDCVKAGFMPMAMLYRDHDGNTEKKWKQFQRTWANPTIIASKMKEIND
jgi:hypothetical protein